MRQGRFQAVRTDVASKNDSNQVHEPSWRQASYTRAQTSGLSGPVIGNVAATKSNRRHRLALDPSAPDKPSQPNPKHNHKDDHPPHAQAQISSPATWGGAGRHRGHSGIDGLEGYSRDQIRSYRLTHWCFVTVRNWGRSFYCCLSLRERNAAFAERKPTIRNPQIKL
jgi:hypothetical protein